MDIYVSMTFDAAHRLPKVPKGINAGIFMGILLSQKSMFQETLMKYRLGH